MPLLPAYAALLALGVIWGSNFIFMKWATALVSPAQTEFLRVLFGFLPLAFMAWRAGVIHRAQLRHLPHFAVMSVLATSFYYYGFVAGTALLSTSVAGLLSGSIPIFTFLCAFLFLRDERPTLRMVMGVTLGFVGIAMSARPWEGAGHVPLAGVFWMLAGTFSLGSSFVYARRFLSPLGLSPLALATWQTGLASVGLGVLGTGGAFLAYYFIIEKLGPLRASGATYIAPVVAVLIGVAAGEQVTALEWGALGLILGGVVLIQTRRR